MPLMPATSPLPATRWSIHPIRTAAGSSQPPRPRSASSSTSTRTLKSRNWTAGKGWIDIAASKWAEGSESHFYVRVWAGVMGIEGNSGLSSRRRTWPTSDQAPPVCLALAVP